MSGCRDLHRGLAWHVQPRARPCGPPAGTLPKVRLRAYGFRCVDIRPAEAGDGNIFRNNPPTFDVESGVMAQGPLDYGSDTP